MALCLPGIGKRWDGPRAACTLRVHDFPRGSGAWLTAPVQHRWFWCPVEDRSSGPIRNLLVIFSCQVREEGTVLGGLALRAGPRPLDVLTIEHRNGKCNP